MGKEFGENRCQTATIENAFLNTYWTNYITSILNNTNRLTSGENITQNSAI